MTAIPIPQRDSLLLYCKIYKSIPEQPSVDRFISRSRRQLVVNLAANRDAKITKLLP